MILSPGPTTYPIAFAAVQRGVHRARGDLGPWAWLPEAGVIEE